MIIKNKLIGLLSLTLLAFSGCATKEQTFWEKGKKGTVVVHHVRRTHDGIHDRAETLTSRTMRPAEVHEYDIGRLPDGNGGLHEAHRYYRVVQSETFDLRLPAEGTVRISKGPKTVFTPPTYSPMPKDQRLNDAVAEAKEAKAKLDAVRTQMEQQLASEKASADQLQAQQQDLATRIQQGLNSTPPGGSTPATPAAQAGAQVVDPLATWNQKVNP